MRHAMLIGTTLILATVASLARAQTPQKHEVASTEAFRKQIVSARLRDDPPHLVMREGPDAPEKRVKVGDHHGGWSLIVLQEGQAILAKGRDLAAVDLTGLDGTVSLTNAKVGGSPKIKLFTPEEREARTKVAVADFTASLKEAAATDPEAAAYLARFEALATAGGRVQMGGAFNPRTGEGQLLLMQVSAGGRPLASISRDGRSFTDVDAMMRNPPPGVEVIRQVEKGP